MNAVMRTRVLIASIGFAFIALGNDAQSTDAYSAQHRLVGSAPASVSAVASSAAYQVYVVGGSGQPVGISASANASLVAGGTSNQLPTERIFLGDFEL